MTTQGILSVSIPKGLEADEDIYSSLNILLEMIDNCNNYSNSFLQCNNSIYSQKINGKEFANWLYDDSDPKLTDMKRELGKIISKAGNIGDDCYQKIIFSIRNDNTTPDCAFFNIAKDENKYSVWSTAEYFDMKRYYLSKHKEKDKFSDDLQECYSNIFFDSCVKSSLHTLNTDFAIIKFEIIAHLKYLDNYYSSFLLHRNNQDNFVTIAAAFKKYSGIDCSPQRSRESTSRLRKTYYNTITNSSEILCCELHTKFQKYNRDNENQDRIYFHPGKDGIHDGRIIVIHIGTHI